MRAAAVLEPFRSPNAEISLLKNLSRDAEIDALLVFGGDGTVHHQLGFLAERKIPLLVVPSGSGNDFAVSLGIEDRQAALELWRSFLGGEARVRELDLGMIEYIGDRKGDVASHCSARNDLAKRYFCNVAGIGLDAAANRRANAWPRWLRAHGGYVLAALAAMFTERAQRIEVTTADRSEAQSEWSTWLDEAARLVAIGNTQSYGGGMRITPGAQPDDGKLDICFVRECSALRLLQLFPSVFKGRH